MVNVSLREGLFNINGRSRQCQHFCTSPGWEKNLQNRSNSLLTCGLFVLLNSGELKIIGYSWNNVNEYRLRFHRCSARLNYKLLKA